MQLTEEQLKIVVLKQWAYQCAYDVARENASHLTKSSERSRIDGKAVEKRADEIFQWLIATPRA